MSLWQFATVMEAWNKAHDPKGDKAISSTEADALWDWIKV